MSGGWHTLSYHTYSWGPAGRAVLTYTRVGAFQELPQAGLFPDGRRATRIERAVQQSDHRHDILVGHTKR